MRQILILISCLVLAACTTGGLRASKDSPFAPVSVGTERAVSNLELGHRLMAAQEYELALKSFTRAAGEEGLTPEVQMGLGSAKLGLGRLGQAEQHFRDALKDDSENPAIMNNLGVVLLETGRINEAETQFRRAFALDNGESVEIRDNLRKALAKQENQVYTGEDDGPYQLDRRGSSEYILNQEP